MPPGGLNIRHEIDQLGQEARLHEYKRAAASAFIRANGLNRIVYSGGRKPKIGIITVGKSYLDVRQALDDIGIDEARANQIGIRLFKVGLPWPLDFEHIAEFARGLEMVIVVEEKRSLIEVQVRESLYGTAMQPLVVGKKDERGDWLFPAKGALDPNEIAIAIGERILKVIGPSEEIGARVAATAPVPGDARRHQGYRAAHALFLLGLPAQFLDQGAGRVDRRRRHRLPFHGAVDGPIDCRLHRDGRRGRAMGRPGAVLDSASIFSRISATAPTTIPACWRCASPSRRAPT